MEPAKKYNALPELEPDATAVRKLGKLPLHKLPPYEDLIRLFPRASSLMKNGFEFKNKTLEEKRETLNRIIRENEVELTPFDLLRINNILYPEHDDERWQFNKEQHERNPKLKLELENYRKRLNEFDSINNLNTLNPHEDNG